MINLNPVKKLKSINLKIYLARAIYANEAENSIELTFNRGDLVTVLDRNPQEIHGWWICSLKGRIGIAPANRLELLGQIFQNNSPTDSDIYSDPAKWYRPTNLELISATSTKQTLNPINQNSDSNYENLNQNLTRRSMTRLTDSGNYSNRSSDVSFGLNESKSPTKSQNCPQRKSFEPGNDSDDSDVYADPTKWYKPKNSEPIQNLLTEQASELSHYNLDSNYVNIDSFVNRESTSALTDSGNYSNRSSDVSMGLKSINEQNDSKFPTKTSTHHQSSNHKDSVSIESGNCTLRTQSLSIDSMSEIKQKFTSSTNRTNSDSETINHIGLLNNSNYVTTNLLKPCNFSGSNKELLKSIEMHTKNLYIHDCDELSSDSCENISSNHLFPNTSGLIIIPNHFNNEKDFIDLWSPIEEHIKNLYKSFMKFIESTNQSIAIWNNLLNLFDRDLLTVCQLCTIFIKLSKQCPDVGLTNKFISCRQSIENFTDQLLRLWKTTQMKTSNNNNNNNNNNNQYIQLSHSDKNEFKIILNKFNKQVNCLHTLILANSKLLFPNLNQPKSKFNQSGSIDLCLNLINRNTEIIKSGQLQNENFYPTQSSHKTADIYDLLDENLKTNFNKLLNKLIISQRIVYDFLNLLTNLQLDSLKTNPFIDFNQKSILSIQTLITSTKQILFTSSTILRLDTLICSNLNQLIDGQINLDEEITFELRNFTNKLELLADRLCESLKGLITQTKEATNYMSNDHHVNSSARIIPIPGPLLQRLTGSIKTVHTTLDHLTQFVQILLPIQSSSSSSNQEK